jgi:hypothetical protein
MVLKNSTSRNKVILFRRIKTTKFMSNPLQRELILINHMTPVWTVRNETESSTVDLSSNHCCKRERNNVLLLYPHFPINDTILAGGGGNWYKMCFDFLYDFCLNIFRSENNSERRHHKWTYAFMLSTRWSCQISIRLQFSRQNLIQNSMKIRLEGI